MPGYRRPRRNVLPRGQVACRALVKVDSVRVRKKALANCRRARTTFEKAEQALTEFETEIQPAYERWRRETFGPRLQEIGEFDERIRELEAKLDMLDLIMFRTDCSPEEAMELLEEELARDEPDSEEAREAEEARRRDMEEMLEEMEEEMEAWEQALASSLEVNRDQIEEARRLGLSSDQILSRFLQAFAADEEMTPEACMRFFPREEVRRLLRDAGLLEEPEEQSAAASDEKSEVGTRVRIKKLVRELAFALHPDQCGEHDEEKLALWHRVREAAEAEDLDELEVLHAHMQLLTGDVGPGVSVARLLDLTRMFRQSRAAIRRRLGRIKHSPAWWFHQAADRDRDRLRRDQDRALREEIHRRRLRLRGLEREWRRMGG